MRTSFFGTFSISVREHSVVAFPPWQDTVKSIVEYSLLSSNILFSTWRLIYYIGYSLFSTDCNSILIIAELRMIIKYCTKKSVLKCSCAILCLQRLNFWLEFWDWLCYNNVKSCWKTILFFYLLLPLTTYLTIDSFVVHGNNGHKSAKDDLLWSGNRYKKPFVTNTTFP